MLRAFRFLRQPSRPNAPRLPIAVCAYRHIVADGPPGIFPTSSPTVLLRDVEVAHLAAGGLSNKEIARSLGITESTTNVERIFRKLGVGNRSDLLRTLHRS
jgi:DNA-binding NarL/FixJ family response regulator